MEFKPLSNRLNYFFPANSWGLFSVENQAELNAEFLNPLKIACNHWNATLEFPLEVPSKAFQDSSEALTYWHRKLPGIRLLHHRKQQILAQQLIQGYDALLSTKLFLRKLNLTTTCWGYLVFFGGVNKSFKLEFTERPEPKMLADAVGRFYRLYGHLIYSETDSLGQNSDSTEIQTTAEVSLELDANWVREIESQWGMSSSMPGLLWLAVNQIMASNRPSRYSHLVNEPDRMTLIPSKCVLEFAEMQLQIKLPPLPFAIYALYIEQEAGFTNKERFQYQNRALYWYKRSRTFRDDSAAMNLLASCFNPFDDKPFRDAIRIIKQKIISEIGDERIAANYLIKGKNGGTKRITIDRNLVNVYP